MRIDQCVCVSSKGSSLLCFWIRFGIPSRELTYPPDKACLKMIFLFPRWGMLVPWRVLFLDPITHPV